MDDLEKRIEAKQVEIERITMTLQKEQRELRRLQLEKIKTDHGVEIGSRVLDYLGREFEVTNINPNIMHRLEGKLVKKDGTPGKRVRRVYDWKKKEE